MTGGLLRPALPGSVVAGLCVVAAGCGGGGPPRVAGVASPTTAAATTTESGTAGAAPARSAGRQPGFVVSVGDAAQGARFSACVRRNGDPTFPDPNARGVITVVGTDRRSPVFQSALSACRKLLPEGFGQGPTPAQQARQRQQALALARCMRAHGIADFPDPANGGLHAGGGPGSDLDPNDPRFRRAESACRSLLPPAGKGLPA